MKNSVVYFHILKFINHRNTNRYYRLSLSLHQVYRLSLLLNVFVSSFSSSLIDNLVIGAPHGNFIEARLKLCEIDDLIVAQSS